MRSLKLFINHNWEVGVAFVLAWTLAGFLGAQPNTLPVSNAPGPATTITPPQGLDMSLRVRGANQAPTQPTDTTFNDATDAQQAPGNYEAADRGELPSNEEYTEGRSGTRSSNEQVSDGQVERESSEYLDSEAEGRIIADPFSRPVEEEITEDLVARTDLSEEGSVIGQIFSSQEQIEQLLGTDATFVYVSAGRRDPMIIPWIRREFDMLRIMQEARAAEESGNFTLALQGYQIVLNEYAGSRAASDAGDAIRRLDDLIRTTSPANATAMSEPEVVLPLEISEGLTGILYESSNPTCLIGDNIYRAGEVIPNFEVTVLQIQESAVTFLYKDHQFAVPVVTN